MEICCFFVVFVCAHAIKRYLVSTVGGEKILFETVKVWCCSFVSGLMDPTNMSNVHASLQKTVICYSDVSGCLV